MRRFAGSRAPRSADLTLPTDRYPRVVALVALVAIGCSPATAQADDPPDPDSPVAAVVAPDSATTASNSAADIRVPSSDNRVPSSDNRVPSAVAGPDPRTEDIAVPVFDPSGDALQFWQNALNRAAKGAGQAKIAWWGASHTAADLWSGYTRRALQDRFGDAGHGYLLPFRWHGGYRHQDVNLSYSRGWTTHRHKLLNPVPTGDYGYGGVAISSNDPKDWFEVATTQENEHGRAASTLEVWLRIRRGGGTLRVIVDGVSHDLSSAIEPRKARKHGRKAKRTAKRRASAGRQKASSKVKP